MDEREGERGRGRIIHFGKNSQITQDITNVSKFLIMDTIMIYDHMMSHDIYHMTTSFNIITTVYL